LRAGWWWEYLMWEGVGTEGCGILCSELHYCYSSPNINVICGRKVIHTCHVACMW
jgi:hypothetical protein